MRREFIEAVTELAAWDERVVLLTGDLGFTVLDPFVERFPERFFNVGVAEQNMLGVATGLAEAGFVPFAYSIATFASMRAYEFIRNGAVLHELPVRIVGVGGGLDYGHNGATHYALEDVALMRVQPDLTVVVPADPAQASAAIAATAQLERPVYFRIGREVNAIPGLAGRFELGRAATIGDARDVALIALGPAAAAAAGAAEQLRERGIAAGIAVVSTFNPTPDEDLTELLRAVPLALTVESHYVTGGLGSAVAELIAERGLGTKLVRCGIEELPRGLTGDPAHLHEHYGLTPDALAATALEALSVAH